MSEEVKVTFPVPHSQDVRVHDGKKQLDKILFSFCYNNEPNELSKIGEESVYYETSSECSGSPNRKMKALHCGNNRSNTNSESFVSNDTCIRYAKNRYSPTAEIAHAPSYVPNKSQSSQYNHYPHHHKSNFPSVPNRSRYGHYRQKSSALKAICAGPSPSIAHAPAYVPNKSQSSKYNHYQHHHKSNFPSVSNRSRHGKNHYRQVSPALKAICAGPSPSIAHAPVPNELQSSKALPPPMGMDYNASGM